MGSFEEVGNDEGNVDWPWKGHQLGGIVMVHARADQGLELAQMAPKHSSIYASVCRCEGTTLNVLDIPTPFRDINLYLEGILWLSCLE